MMDTASAALQTVTHVEVIDRALAVVAGQLLGVLR